MTSNANLHQRRMAAVLDGEGVAARLVAAA